MNPLEGTGVSRHFGSVVAVQSADISVAEGEVVGLVGANGSGKTTLIRILLGLLPPTSGSVRLFGEAPTRSSRARVGYVPQLGGLYDELTVAQNLEFTTRAYGRDGDQLAAGWSGDLEAVRDVRVGNLPLGYRRRIAFALAMAHGPRVLVLDEPTSGVDPLARSRLWERIRRAAERGCAVLVTTHHTSEATECDRLVVLAEGRVTAEGSEAHIVEGWRVVEVRSDGWAAAFSALEAAGLMVGLRGKSVRVVDAEPTQVAAILSGSAIQAQLAVLPATLDEAFVRLASESRA